jgi:hypothetical protein
MLPGQAQHAAEFQTLPGNGQDQKATPPRSNVPQGPARQPETVPSHPQQRAKGHGHCGEGTLLTHNDGKDGHESQAAQRHKRRCWQSDKERQRPCSGEQRGNVRPECAHGNSPFNTNQRTEKATDHHGAVRCRQGRTRER